MAAALQSQFPDIEADVVAIVFESSGRDHAATVQALQEMSSSASPAPTPAPAPLVGEVLGLSNAAADHRGAPPAYRPAAVGRAPSVRSGGVARGGRSQQPPPPDTAGDEELARRLTLQWQDEDQPNGASADSGGSSEEYEYEYVTQRPVRNYITITGHWH